MTFLREARRAAGLTQAELAARAGVSRQLVGAVEAGRHLPRVDAALALAVALDIEVEKLFGSDHTPVDVLAGSEPIEGSLVRVGRVGDRTVTTPTRLGSEGFDLADGVIRQGSLLRFASSRPGVVVAGCEPGLEILERLLRRDGSAAVAVTASTAASIRALVAERVHAAVVHGPVGDIPSRPPSVALERVRLARWRVGMATAGGVDRGWWKAALSGRVPVVQREGGAAVQQAFLRAAGRESVEGPIVGGHLEAVRWGLATGLAAVTIEPAATVFGARFHPLEEHEAELWMGAHGETDGVADETLSVLTDRTFRRHLEAVGGYDLASSGTRVP